MANAIFQALAAANADQRDISVEAMQTVAVVQEANLIDISLEAMQTVAVVQEQFYNRDISLEAIQVVAIVQQPYP